MRCATVFVVSWAVSCAGVDLGQTTTGRLIGTVTDDAGSLLAAVTVTTAPPALIGGPRIRGTDGNGEFSFISIAPGECTVRAEHPGFVIANVSGLAREYLGFIVKMMVAFGIGFEFPIVLIFLQLAGLVHHTTLRRGRHYAIIGIVVLVALITPSGDPFTLMVLSVPLYFFYEFAILFGRLRDRRARKRATAEADKV